MSQDEKFFTLDQLAGQLSGTYQPTTENAFVTGREAEQTFLTQFFLSAMSDSYMTALTEHLYPNIERVQLTQPRLGTHTNQYVTAVDPNTALAPIHTATPKKQLKRGAKPVIPDPQTDYTELQERSRILRLEFQRYLHTPIQTADVLTTEQQQQRIRALEMARFERLQKLNVAAKKAASAAKRSTRGKKSTPDAEEEDDKQKQKASSSTTSSSTSSSTTTLETGLTPEEEFKQFNTPMYPHGQAIYLMGTPGIGKTLLSTYLSHQFGLDGSITHVDPQDHKQQFIFINANYRNNTDKFLAELIKQIHDYDHVDIRDNLKERPGQASGHIEQLFHLCCSPLFYTNPRNKKAPKLKKTAEGSTLEFGYQRFVSKVPPQQQKQTTDNNKQNKESTQPPQYILSDIPYQTKQPVLPKQAISHAENRYTKLPQALTTNQDVMSNLSLVHDQSSNCAIAHSEEVLETPKKRGRPAAKTAKTTVATKKDHQQQEDKDTNTSQVENEYDNIEYTTVLTFDHIKDEIDPTVECQMLYATQNPPTNSTPPTNPPTTPKTKSKPTPAPTRVTRGRKKQVETDEDDDDDKEEESEQEDNEDEQQQNNNTTKLLTTLTSPPYTNEYITQNDVQRFTQYQQYLSNLDVSYDFGVRFPHSASIILVVDEFDQLPPTTAADLIRISCSPFSRLFLIGLGNKLDFMDSVVKHDGMANATIAVSKHTSALVVEQLKVRDMTTKKAQKDFLEDEDYASATEKLLAKASDEVVAQFLAEDKEQRLMDMIQEKHKLQLSIVPFQQYTFQGFNELILNRNLYASKLLVDWVIAYYHYHIYTQIIAKQQKLNKSTYTITQRSAMSDAMETHVVEQPATPRGKRATKRKLTEDNDLDSALSTPTRRGEIPNFKLPPPDGAQEDGAAGGKTTRTTSSSNKKQKVNNTADLVIATPQKDGGQDPNQLVTLFANPTANNHLLVEYMVQQMNPNFKTTLLPISEGACFKVTPQTRHAVYQYLSIIHKLSSLLATKDAITFVSRNIATLSSDVRSCLEVWKSKMSGAHLFLTPTLYHNTLPSSSQTSGTFTPGASPAGSSGTAPLSPTKRLLMKMKGIGFNPFSNSTTPTTTDTPASSAPSSSAPASSAAPASRSLTNHVPTKPADPIFPLLQLVEWVLLQLALPELTARYTLHTLYQQYKPQIITNPLATTPPTPGSAAARNPVDATLATYNLKPITTLQVVLQGKSIEQQLVDKTVERLSKLSTIRFRTLLGLLLVLRGTQLQQITFEQFGEVCDTALQKVGLNIMNEKQVLLDSLQALEMVELIKLRYISSAGTKLSRSFHIQANVDVNTFLQHLKTLPIYNTAYPKIAQVLKV